MQKYKTLTRTTMSETDNLPHSGIYVIAYMKKIIYVGIASSSVADRIEHHLRKHYTEDFGEWLHKMRPEWNNIRLDVLEVPDNCDVRTWLKAAEAELIHKFKPLFNKSLNV